MGKVGLGDLPGGQFSSSAWGVSAGGSVVVGVGHSASGQEGFRWTQATGMVGLGDLPGGNFSSFAWDVSPDGSVVVGVSSSASGGEAFRWTQATGMVGLGDLPGGAFYSQAEVVSADGALVAGFSQPSPGHWGQHAFIWDADHGMRSLRDVLVNQLGLDLGGWHLRAVTGVSADGLTIVGPGFNPQGQAEAWRAVIPEPATLALFAAGGLLLLRRRQKRRSR